ncbi:NAD(P)-binding protein [Irpex rosettiformis]|uniref:NAD(P)-binding protein n=1 Tax=Irpex rosettiformis TaxID=378272 RepID=A0ACB8UGE1_9APHY|nr:NAD(P)-binding protein [Irpex rosettiformis]
MVQVTDEELLAHAERINGKVVLITGGGSGIGKHAALLYAQYGAKVVIGDINVKSAEETVKEIVSAAGSVIAQACDTTVWEDQVSLFELAVKTYGTIDIVVANAGIMDVPIFPIKNKDGTLSPPKLSTMDVNLTGTIYTVSLATHFLASDPATRTPDTIKAVIMVGSVASFKPIYGGVQYTSSKHAVLGLQRAIGPVLTAKGIRSGSVNPCFVQTNLVKGIQAKGLLTGIPLVPVDRVAATILAIATNPVPETSEKPWLLLDGGEVERLDDFDLDEGLYKQLNIRTKYSLQPPKPFVVPEKKA